jgi:hypothetical protein
MPLSNAMSTDSKGATIVVAAQNATAAEKSAADFVCDGTSDQVEINAAVNALPAEGGSIRLTGGTFNTTDVIYVRRQDTAIQGSGIATLVQNAGGSAPHDVFSLGNGTDTYANLALRYLKLAPSVQRTVGGCGIHIDRCFKVWIEDVYVERQYRSIQLNNSTQVFLQNLAVRDTYENGITIEADFMDGFDWYINNLVMDNPNVTNQGTGIAWYGGETLVMSGADIMRFRVGMDVNPSSGREARWAFIQNTILDTCYDNGLHIGNTGSGNVTGLTFVNCWTSTHANYGVLIDKNGTGYLEGIRFIGHKVFNNGLAGVALLGGSRITISDSDIVSNSTAVPGTRSGVEVGAGVSYFSLLDCTCTNGYGHGSSQEYGIKVNPGASDYYRIVGCDLSGNVQVAGFLDEGIGLHKVVADNLV